MFHYTSGQRHCERENAEIVVEVTGETGEVSCETSDLGKTGKVGETDGVGKVTVVTGEVAAEMGEVMGVLVVACSYEAAR